MQGLAPYWIDPADDSCRFPDVEHALHEPDGLLAVGGDLRPRRLLAAYSQGIFPWYNEDQPILWWAPDPRMVLFPEHLKISRSLHKTLRKDLFRVTLDTAFADVILACAEPRSGTDGTWISQEMIQAYCRLHELGYAHSVECWREGELVGGLYGVAIGQVFFGESMFARATDASKVAFIHLVQQLARWSFRLIDCQIYSSHLQSLGAKTISRKDFCRLIEQYCELPRAEGKWQFENTDAISPSS